MIMEELFMAESHAYLFLHNPEILIKDSQIFTRPRLLKNKVKQTSDRIMAMIAAGSCRQEIIDQSVELITEELRPSRFGYVCAVIASEFPKTFLRWVRIDELAEQVLDVVNACEPVFCMFKFNSQKTEQHSIYQTVKNFIGHYLKRKRRCQTARPALQVTGQDNQPVIEPMGLQVLATVVTPTVETKEIAAINPVKVKQRTYFKSALLENYGAVKSKASKRASVVSAPISETIETTRIMASKQYPINKGINKSIVFKGLKAQYIGYMGLGLLIDLVFYAVLYMLKVNTYVTLLLTVSLGALLAAGVYHLNAQYGEHGLEKALAKRKIPRRVRSFSRRIFR
jgi:hypothetical protein